MRPSIKYVENKFDDFNKLIFGGRLPRIRVRMSEAVTFLGMCVAKVRTLPDGRREYYDFELRISLNHDIAEREIEDVIIHEMIHYFIMYNQLIDTSPHGEIFRSMMNSINRNYGRNITVSRRSTSDERTKVRESKVRWHVIAVINLNSGKTGLKVLPRVVPKIIDYERRVSSLAEVRDVELYLHNNPFFNRYPTSDVMKIHYIDRETVDLQLVGASRLLVKNGKLIQR